MQGAGSALSTMGTKDNSNELALQQAKSQAELAEQKKNHRTKHFGSYWP